MAQFPGNLVRPVSGYERYRPAREAFYALDEDAQMKFIEAMDGGYEARQDAVAGLLGDDDTTGAEGTTPPASAPAEQPTGPGDQPPVDAPENTGLPDPAPAADPTPAQAPAGEQESSSTPDDDLAAVLHGNVGEVIDYAEANPARAARLAELERASKRPRVTLLDDLDRIAADQA